MKILILIGIHFFVRLIGIAQDSKDDFIASDSINQKIVDFEIVDVNPQPIGGYIEL